MVLKAKFVSLIHGMIKLNQIVWVPTCGPHMDPAASICSPMFTLLYIYSMLESVGNQYAYICNMFIYTQKHYLLFIYSFIYLFIFMYIYTDTCDFNLLCKACVIDAYVPACAVSIAG